MPLVVPFDGSELAEAALIRATEFDRTFEEAVLVISVIPVENTAYARNAGWIGSDETFDMDTIVSRLKTQVAEIAPMAEFRHIAVVCSARPGIIANRIRRVARDELASMVVIGRESAGRLVTSVSSVAGDIATDAAYDVVIVRHRSPARIPKLRDVSPV